MGLRTVVHVTPHGRHSLKCVRACVRNLRSVTQGQNSQVCSLHSSPVVRMGLPSMGSAEVIPMTDPFLSHDLCLTTFLLRVSLNKSPEFYPCLQFSYLEYTKHEAIYRSGGVLIV
jgi:hypothetical protein